VATETTRTLPIAWALLLTALLLGPGAAPAGADVPELLGYQGILSLPGGKAPEDGSYELRFEILDGTSSPVFTEQLPVEVRSGFYGVLLGGQSATPLSSVFDGSARSMRVTIVSSAPEPWISDVTLVPDQTIAAVPYALAAKTAAEYDPAAVQPVPAGAIVLWDQPTGCDDVARACPCGWAEAGEFQDRMVRGADTTSRWEDLANAPGQSLGTTSEVGPFGDQLSEAEAPRHVHGTDPAGSAGHTRTVPPFDALTGNSSGSKQWMDRGSVEVGNPAGRTRVIVSSLYTGEGKHSHVTDAAGGGAAHRHPSIRVLFCRKEG